MENADCELVGFLLALFALGSRSVGRDCGRAWNGKTRVGRRIGFLLALFALGVSMCKDLLPESRGSRLFVRQKMLIFVRVICVT